MRVLVGTIVAGTAKAYAVEKFEEMCTDVFRDLPVLAVVDGLGRTALPTVVDARMAGTFWATEIVYYGKETLARFALGNGYDAVVWQGIDCYYDRRSELDRLIAAAADYPIAGGLVAGRDKENYPVCHPFRRDAAGRYLPQGEPLDVDIEGDGVLEIPGYIGSDATIVRRDALETVTMDGYEHWHARQQADPGHLRHLGPEEWFMWSAVARHGMMPALLAGVRPWHAHETGRTVRYKGGVCNLSSVGGVWR